MKKRLLAVLTTVLCSTASFAQIWTGTNPVWHYNYTNGDEEGYIKIEQTGTSVIEGKSCQELTAIKHKFSATGLNGAVEHTEIPYGLNYVYASNDTVYYYQDSVFRVLYKFAPAFASSWLVGLTDPAEFASQCNDTSYTTAIAITTVNLGTETAASVQLSSNLGSELQLYGQTNSHFGAMESYLFPLRRSCDPNFVGSYDTITFKCFEDDVLTYNPSGTDCEYLLTQLGIDRHQQLQLSVYPNPAAGSLNVQVTEGAYHYRIVSVTGEVVAENKLISNGEATISTDRLDKGSYFLELSDGSSVQGRIPFIKQ